MSTTVIENKTLEERCGFSAKGAWIKMRLLRAKYGVKELARLTGLSVATINNYCSESYMKRYKFQEATWERYFGKWGLKEPVFPNADNQDTEEDPIMDAIEQGEEIMVETVEQPIKEQQVEEKKEPRLILEVGSLEELDEALKRFGFKMIIE